MQLRAILRTLWAVLSVTPMTHLCLHGASRTTAAALGLYALGWLLLELGIRRDPTGEELWTFARTVPGRLLLPSLLAGLQFISPVLSLHDGCLLVVAGGVALLLLWVVSGDGTRMAVVTGRGLLLCGAVFVPAVLGELVLRLPWITIRTGGTAATRDSSSSRNYDFSWERNVFGIRSFHAESTRRPESLRVVVLGDSMTWGDKVSRTEDTWPYVLERHLIERCGDVEVINLARRGYTTVNEAESLERLGWSFQPDLLIMQFYVNDTLPSGPDFRSEPSSWHYRTVPLSPLKHSQLAHTSYLYSYLNEQFDRLQRALFYADGYLPLFRADFDGWIAAQDALAGVAEQARQRGVPILFVLFPQFTDLRSDAYPYLSIHRDVQQAAKAIGLQVLDLRHRYAEIDPNGRAWWVLPWDAHPSVEAHAVAAAAIDRSLASTGVLEEALLRVRSRSTERR